MGVKTWFAMSSEGLPERKGEGALVKTVSMHLLSPRGNGAKGKNR